MVLFPLDDGKFKSAQITIGATYDVHGNPQNLDTASSTASTHNQFTTPYGVYTNPTFKGGYSPPPPHPPRSSKTSKIKKTIMMVSLTAKQGKTRGQSKLEYTTVTQVVVSLSQSQCNVPTIAQQVTQQVGFEVILLDSKCYPLLPNEGTSGIEFWKSTRKILGASKSHYERVSGSSADINIADAYDDEPGPSNRKTLEVGPSKRRHILEEESVPNDSAEAHFKLILEKFTLLERKLSFLDEIFHTFQCVICQCCSRSHCLSLLPKIDWVPILR